MSTGQERESERTLHAMHVREREREFARARLGCLGDNCVHNCVHNIARVILFLEQVLPRAEEYMQGLPEPAGVPQIDQTPAAAPQHEAPSGEEEVEASCGQEKQAETDDAPAAAASPAPII